MRIINLIYLTIFLSNAIAQEPLHYLFNADNGLPTNEVYACYETDKGQLYVGHDLGLSIYDGKEFKPVEIKGLKEGVSCYGIYRINETLWFKFTNQLYYLENGNILPYKFNETLKSDEIGIIYHFTFIKGELHFSTANKGFSINQNGTLKRVDLNKEILWLDRENRNIIRQCENGLDSLYLEYSGQIVNSFCMHSQVPHFGVEFNQNDIYWNAGVLYYFNQDKFKIIQIDTLYGKAYNAILSVQQIKDKLYVSTKVTGLQIFQKYNGDWIRDSELLSDSFIGIISNGKSGLWAPIINKGLAFFPNPEIQNYKLEKEVKNIYLEKELIYAVSMDQFDQYPVNIIKENGIDQAKDFDFPKLTYNHYERVKESKPITRTITKSNVAGIISPIKNRKIFTSIYVNSFLTKDYFIQASNYYISTESRKYEIRDTFRLKRIQSLHLISNNTFLIGGTFGLKKFEINQNEIREINLSTRFKDILEIKSIDPSRKLITTIDAVHIYNWQKDLSEKQLYKNKKGQIKSSFLHENLLFIGTKNYFEIIDLNSNKSLSLNRSSGLSSTNITDIIANDSIIILAHETGVSTIPTDLIRNKLNEQEPDYNKYISYFIYGNSLELSFSFYELNPWSKIRTQYSLNNSDYIDFTSDELILTNLQSGLYNLNIRFRIADGKWINLNPINYEIPAPFYMKWWFSGGIVLLIASIVILIIKRRNTIKTKNLETEKLIETLRMNALTSQMNPHFLYNALNTIQGLLSGDKKLVFMYVSDLARFFRMMLNNSSELYIPVRKEIELNQIFCDVEAVRQYREVNFIVNYEDKELKDIKIPSMIIQPFVENAMWHAFTKEIENPEILINVASISNSVFQISIQDNGIGISNTKNRNKVHQSKGVSIVENRLKIFNSGDQTISKNIILTDRNEVDPNLHGTLVLVNLTKKQKENVQDSDY
jgi:hypothetical protein